MGNLFMQILNQIPPERLGMLISDSVKPEQYIPDKNILRNKARGTSPLKRVFDELYGGKNVL